MPTITLPHNYKPRHYQLPLLQALDEGCKRAVYVAHRRSGKDKTAVNIFPKEMMQRVGTYWGVFPELKQGRKILWDGMDADGFKFLNHFPYELRGGIDGNAGINNSEMKLSFRNGSIFQIIGDDNIDSNVGSNPVFAWFDEYSLHNPRGWGLISPILEQNGGKALFTYTPRGENHGKTLFDYAMDQDDWFCGLYTASDTGIFTKQQLERIRLEYVSLYGDDSLFYQEYMCDFTVPIQGAYYATHMRRAMDEGRITHVPYDERYTVETYWDIGRTDYTAVWFAQRIGLDIRLIDYLETTGVGIHEIAPMVLSKPYIYSRHVGPHDIEQGEWGSADKSRRDTATKLGIRFEVAPRLSIQDGIDAGRAILPRCWFDADKCKDGVDALKSYHKQYDDKRKVYLKEPYHDWSSHGADGFRTMAVSIDDKAQALPAKRDKYRRTSSNYVYAGNPDAV